MGRPVSQPTFINLYDELLQNLIILLGQQLHHDFANNNSYLQINTMAITFVQFNETISKLDN